MSRRGTIIAAVLVNAALLMILFATAVRSDKLSPERPIQLAQESDVPEKTRVEDDLFNQYIVTSLPTLAPETTPLTEEIELVFTPVEPIAPKRRVETPKTEGKYVEVTVKKGDYLDKIAQANSTTVAAIVETNHLSSTQLQIGQVLKIPLSEAKPKKITPSASAEGEFYVVKEGDSPWLIASRNKIRLDELLRLNGLDEQKARRLRPGDRLRIR